MSFFFFLITVTTHFKNVAARMFEAAAQRGFWCARVDANGIEKRKKKKKQKKKIAQLSSQETFLCKLSTAQIFCIVVCTIL